MLNDTYKNSRISITKAHLLLTLYEYSSRSCDALITLISKMKNCAIVTLHHVSSCRRTYIIKTLSELTAYSWHCFLSQLANYREQVAASAI